MDDRQLKNSMVWISLLTFSAGLTNGEAAWGTGGLAVSHHTGNLTQLAAALHKSGPSLLLILCGILLSFFAGSVLAGILFYQRTIGQSAIYGSCSLVQGALTIALPFLLPSAWSPGIYFFAALALGLQNGILFNFKGLLTRTTHMTGYLTDAGVALGERLRGKKENMWQLAFLSSQLLFFILGATLGFLSGRALEGKALLLVGLVQILSGAFYLFQVKAKRAG